MSEFGKILKLLRKNNHESQKKLANKLKISQSSLSSWENGTEPSITVLSVIADYYQVSTDYLLGREDEEGLIVIRGPSLSHRETLILSYLHSVPVDSQSEFLKCVSSLSEICKTIY